MCGFNNQMHLHLSSFIRNSSGFSLSSLRFLPPGVGLTGSSRPSKVLLEFKALILKTEHKQTLQSVVMLDCIEQILTDREDISHLG